MTRRCERPGCSEPASVSFRFDPRRRLVELFPGLSDVESQAGALCRRHGDAMVLPRGWVLDDQRDLVPRLFSVDRASERTADPGADGSDDTGSRSRRRRRSGQDGVEQSEQSGNLFVVPPPQQAEPGPTGEDSDATDATGDVTVADVAGAHPDAAPDETRAMPWVPVFDPTDSLGGVLDATTPMLRRAFGTDHRRRSP